MQVLKDDIKRRILDVARQEFYNRGFTRASMRDIASKVGVGVGNLYNYYRSKDDLFCGVLAPVVSACYDVRQTSRGVWTGCHINDAGKLFGICGSRVHDNIEGK